MTIIGTIIRIVGSLGLFLYGMKVMSDGIQQGTGERLQRILGYMTGNRLTAVVTGLSVTAIIQSSSALTVMTVSFVNAGIMSLTQAIGVIMGANIGTTITAWIVSIVGFTLSVQAMAVPAIGIGFLMSVLKWKHQEVGNAVLGFGLLFLGLDFLTKSMPQFSADNFEFVKNIGNGMGSILIFIFVGFVMTILIHSSSATSAIILTMSYNGIINFDAACAMMLGANIGTCIDAVIGSIGTRTNAKRAALVHVLFNVVGVIIVLLFFKPFLKLVDICTPGIIGNSITNHIAMFHTLFNVINTIIFFPFVNQFSNLVCFLIKDKKDDVQKTAYRFQYQSGSIRDTPELSILRAKNEIRDMAGIVLSMYESLRIALKTLDESTVAKLTGDLSNKEEYADQMREALTSFLMECTRGQLNRRSQNNVALQLRIIADLEDMTDDCYSISLLLERSVKKSQVFKNKEIEALDPYMKLVSGFLAFVREHSGGKLEEEERLYAKAIEEEIDLSRNKLRKLGRKRIEEGENVKTELLFIDLVRRIERLGDFCYSIANSMAHMV
ncbi:phosphate:sodium symporter [Spirochaetia bacterium]|nr:phosphate:sodium symporter [Spirochaetia bacterium]